MMQQMIWFTPDGIEDLLPSQAYKLEHYRRSLVDEFQMAGYGLILTPIAEFTDSLLTGTGQHQATELCRFTDQESGKMMGVRADVTPQVARIVSNRIKPTESELPVRLCYVAEVLRTRNNKAKGSRSPIQAGVELFGIDDVTADIEVIELMIDALQNIGIEDLTLSLGHVGIFNELIQLAELGDIEKQQLVDILQRKAVPEYETFLAEKAFNEPLKTAFSQFLNLTGEPKEALLRAAKSLSGLSPNIDQFIERLATIVAHFSETPDVNLFVDLAELRGFHYHTGVIFGCYASSKPLYLLAKGGRYNGVGVQFGQDLPATGFSMDLRGALDLLPEVMPDFPDAVYAPVHASGQLKQKIKDLKSQGIQVIKCADITQLPEGSQYLAQQDDEWMIETIKSEK
ncbi:ATP phosphoribosyltransferase regulatory subunit [Galenea microaerophila]